MNSLNKILVIGVVRRSKTRKYKKIGQEVQKNSRKNLFISFLNEIKQIDETKQTTTTQKKKATSKNYCTVHGKCFSRNSSNSTALKSSYGD